MSAPQFNPQRVCMACERDGATACSCPATALYEAARIAAQAFRTLEEVAVAQLEHDKARNFIRLGDTCRAALAKADGAQ